MFVSLSTVSRICRFGSKKASQMHFNHVWGIYVCMYEYYIYIYVLVCVYFI